MTKIAATSYVLAGTGTWVLYCRVSTTQQAEDGISMEAQRSQLLQRMQDRGGSLKCLCMDFGLSAKDTARPALLHGLGLCARGDTFAVVDTTRLSRDHVDAGTIQKDLRRRRVELVVLNMTDISSSQGRAMYAIASVMGQMEREATAAKVSSVMKTRIQEGKLYPRPPYGYASPGPRLAPVPVPAEQAAVQYIRTRMAEEPLLPAAVLAKELDVRGYPRRGSKVWRCDTVQDICLRHGIPCATRRAPRGVRWVPTCDVGAAGLGA